MSVVSVLFFELQMRAYEQEAGAIGRPFIDPPPPPPLQQFMQALVVFYVLGLIWSAVVVLPIVIAMRKLLKNVVMARAMAAIVAAVAASFAFTNLQPALAPIGPNLTFLTGALVGVLNALLLEWLLPQGSAGSQPGDP